MDYRVTYMIGERVSESVMNQRELDECRANCEVIEAVVISQREDPATPHNAQAVSHDQADEGWGLFEIGLSGLAEIQRDDEMAIFETDEDAVEHVKHMAAQGSQRHQEALARHLADAPHLSRGA